MLKPREILLLPTFGNGLSSTPVVMICLAFYGCLPALSPVLAEGLSQRDSAEPVLIQAINPDPRGGKAYRLEYRVDVPEHVYWAFKTDFDNDFLEDNRFIKAHRFLSRSGNTVVTETRYTNGPEAFFRWQTTLHPERRRLEFLLLNPQVCGQRFHYGSIQMEADGGGTRVTQVAYFDFPGILLWFFNPWRGGMKAFLTYTASWEQKTVLRLQNRYETAKSP